MQNININTKPVASEAARETVTLKLPKVNVNYQRETHDVLHRLQTQVAKLEDLTGRLGFALSEVQTLIRR